jgi:hypothetical protein
MLVFENDKATPASFPVVPIILLKALRQEQCHGLREEIEECLYNGKVEGSRRLLKKIQRKRNGMLE